MLGNLAEVAIINDWKFGHNGAGTRQAPTKTGRSSSGSATSRYKEIASLMFFSTDARSGA